MHKDTIDPCLLMSMGHAAKEHVEATGLEPDHMIGRNDEPYLRRWYMARNAQQGSIYLHQFLIGDESPHLHDHPWDWTALILDGRYREHRPGGYAEHGPGDVIGPRQAEDLHRIELIQGPVWTLFLTGPRRREWGFQTEAGWVPWQEYLGEEAT